LKSELKQHHSSVSGLAIDGEYVFSSSGDKSIRIYDIRTSKCIKRISYSESLSKKNL